MKKYKRCLSILIALPFAIILILMLWVRLMINDVVGDKDFSKDQAMLDNDQVIKQYDFADFQRIRIQGYWKVEIKPGEEYSVMVSGPEYKVSSSNINQTGDQINLLEKFPALTKGERMEVLIFIPDLVELKARGDCRIYIDDLTCDNLILDLGGVGHLIATNNEINRLDLTGRGKLDLDLEDSRITDAILNLSGDINTDITMNGGELTGRLNGNVDLDYAGVVSREKVGVHGSSSLEKHEF